MKHLRNRLALAAGHALLRGYKGGSPEILALGLLNGDIKPVRESEALTLELSLSDVTELIEATKELERYRKLYREKISAETSWRARLDQAKAVMTTQPRLPFNTRASQALRVLGLVGRTKRCAIDPETLCARYHQLLDGDYCPESDTWTRPIKRPAAIQVLADEFGKSVDAIEKHIKRKCK